MSRTFTLGVVISLAACAVSAAGVGCSSEPGRSGFGDGTSSGQNTSGGTGFGGDGGGEGGKVCTPNPAHYDIPGNNCDDDGDGEIDNPPSCDDSLSEGGDAEDFAKAMGICQTAAKDGYGFVSAEYTQGHGVSTAARSGQHGILPKFGNVLKPREGKRLGVLSTGFAQEFNGQAGRSFVGIEDSQGWDGLIDPSGVGKVPNGFPKPAAGCQLSDEVYDVVNLKLTLKAPPNASGIKFDFNFHSGEWPAFICTQYNDAFIAYLSAQGFNGGTPDNVSFDKDKNPVSVNNGFFDRCTPGVETGCAGTKTAQSVCPGGPGELAGTGFGLTDQICGTETSTKGGATGWLTSQAPVTPGEEFTIELMVWDTGDAILDSSVLLDNFTWVEGEVTTATDRPPR
jgi:hypothetical protein